MIWIFLFLIHDETKPLQNVKIKYYSQKGDPWGDSDGQKTTFEQQLLLFLLCLLKNNELIRMKYAQKHFESTFGSAYFKQKKTKLKLVKTVKKGTKESKLSMEFWLAVWESNEMCTGCWILSFKNKNINLMHANYGFSLNCHAKLTISLNYI